MTEKERAHEIFNEMVVVIGSRRNKLVDQIARDCAILTVDRIGAECKRAGTLDYRIPYWQKVKLELEKL